MGRNVLLDFRNHALPGLLGLPRPFFAVFALFFACLVFVLPAQADVRLSAYEQAEYLDFTARVVPTTVQRDLLNQIIEDAKRYLQRHPKLGKKLRSATRNMISARRWNPIYAEQGIRVIKQSTRGRFVELLPLINQFLGSLSDKQRNGLNLFLLNMTLRSEQRFEKEIEKIENYGGLAGTVFVGFGAEQRETLGQLLGAIRSTHNNNRDLRSRILGELTEIVLKKSLSKLDLNAYLNLVGEQISTYENTAIKPLETFLNSLTEKQKGRLLYLYDEAEKKRAAALKN